MSGKFQYNRTFSNNILVVGQTGFGKTNFVQNLGRNKMFGDGLISVDWISKINWAKSREAKIKTFFNYTNVEFHYPDDIADLNPLLKHFKKTRLTVTTTAKRKAMAIVIFLEKKKLIKSFVRNNVSGVANKPNDFNNFLTASQKFGYICLYIIHIIYPTKSFWQMILSLTRMFNIFSFSIHLWNIPKIFNKQYNREASNYIPARNLWINSL